MWSSKRPCKADQNSWDIFPALDTWRVLEEMNLQLDEKQRTSFQLCWNLASGLHYARFHGSFYMCFMMNIRALGKRLVQTETMIQDWKLASQSKAAGRVPKCGEKVPTIPVCIFAILTTLCRNLEVYTCMTSSRRVGSSVSIEHTFKKGTF